MQKDTKDNFAADINKSYILINQESVMEEVQSSSLSLTAEEIKILNGGKGPVLQKVMESVVRYGEAFGATHLEAVMAPGHLIISAGASMVTAYYDNYR